MCRLNREPDWAIEEFIRDGFFTAAQAGAGNRTTQSRTRGDG
jgi:hypothetical protein